MEEIKKIVDSFPELPKRERSMIEIGGCRNDENVNSDYLAFFLREDEEHNLGRLFFDALLEVLEFKIDDYQGSYEVEREFSTSKKNRIDIVIQSKDKNWAIIIENKIYHYLKNDLQDYWDSVNVENKKGVILSLKKEHEKYHNLFTNITHKELIDEVKKNLGQNFLAINPKYLPFLQDFILNVENYYYYGRIEVQNAYHQRIMYFYKHQEKRKEVVKDIDSVFNRQIENIKFTTDGTKNTDYWLYYDKNKNFQIYYNREDILGEKRLLYIRLSIKKDLFEKIKGKIEFIKEEFKDKKIEIVVGEKTKEDAGLTQIFTAKYTILETTTNYIEVLNEIINTIGKNILPELNELISKNK